MAKGIPENWLAALPQPLLSSITSFTSIDKGRADTCFLSLNTGRTLFAKLSNSRLLEIEAKTLNFLAANKTFISFSFPTFYDSSSKFLLTHKVCGVPINDKVEELISQKILANALAELHSLDTSEIRADHTLFHWPNLGAFEQTLDSVSCELSIKTKLLDKLSDVLKALTEIPSLLGFIHGDLTPDNLLLSEQASLIVLDWELADIRDVRWDLATLCEELSLTETQVQQLVTDYQNDRQITEPSFASGLTAWRFIYLVVCFIWAFDEQQEYRGYLTKLCHTI